MIESHITEDHLVVRLQRGSDVWVKHCELNLHIVGPAAAVFALQKDCRGREVNSKTDFMSLFGFGSS